MKELKVEYSSMIYTKNNLIGYNSLSGSFFNIDLSLNILKFIPRLGTYELETRFSSGCVKGNKLYYAPCISDEMVEVTTSEHRKIHVEFEKEIPHRFSGVQIVDEEIYLIPGCANGIVVLDKDGNRVAVINDWISKLKSIIPKEVADKKIFGKTRYGRALCMGDELWIPLLHTPSILRVNTQKYRTELVSFNNEDSLGFLALYGDENEQFILTRNTNEILELRDGKIYGRYTVPMEHTRLGRSALLGNKIIILGFDRPEVIGFDLKRHEFVNSNINGLFDIEEKTDFGALVEEDNSLFVYENNKGKLLKLTVLGYEIEIQEIIIEIDRESLQLLMKEKADLGQIIEESDTFSLTDFLNIKK